MTHSNLRVTPVQANLVWENKQANLAHLTELITDVKDTDLIILPEMFTTGFSMTPHKFAETMQGDTLRWMQNTAREKHAAIIGSLIISENEKFYNRLIFMQPSGEFSSYDKRHLFSFAGEDKHYTAGNTHLIVELNGWKIKPLICYDLRFPVWSRNKKDYDILVYIANWPDVRSKAWDCLLYARAIENQAYTIGVNRVGTDGNGIYHSGGSLIISPKGNKMSAIQVDKEDIETVELSYTDLHKFRVKFPALNDADKFQTE